MAKKKSTTSTSTKRTTKKKASKKGTRKPRGLQTTARDRKIIHHLGLFGFLTVETLHRRFFAELSTDAANSWVKRMTSFGIITSANRSLDGKRVYYQLTPKGVDYAKRVLGLTVVSSARKVLRNSKKPQRYGHLLYITPEVGAMREAFRPCDEPQNFPELQGSDSQSDPLSNFLFYREVDLVGCVEADSGAPNYVFKKLAPKIKKLSLIDSFYHLIQAKRFRLTVVTVSDARTRQVKRQFKKLSTVLQWEVVCIPDVGAVLPKKRAARILQTNQNGATKS